MQFSSKLIEAAVDAFAGLPGIGKKTALRLVLNLVQRPTEDTVALARALADMRQNIQHCITCGNLSDQNICGICRNERRDRSTICVVESIRDVMAIEETRQYRGVYHVLGGVIAPIEGVGPADLNIDTLIERAKHPETKEIIMAISPTIEGDTTIFYINRLLLEVDVALSNIARGVSFGGELEYADEVTLGRSIVARTKIDG